MAYCKVNASSAISNIFNDPLHTDFSVSKPVLPRLLKTYQSMHKTLEASSHISVDALERKHAELKLLSHEEMAVLQKKAELVAVENSWSFLSTLASYSSVICNLGLHFILSPTDNTSTTQYVMLAATALNTLYVLIENFGGLDRLYQLLEENQIAKQESIKKIAPFMFFLANTLASSLSAVSSKALPASYQTLASLLKDIPQQLQTLAGFKDAYIGVLKSDSEFHYLQNKGVMKYHEDFASLFTQLLDLSIQQTRSIKTNLKKPILSLIQASSMAAKRV